MNSRKYRVWLGISYIKGRWRKTQKTARERDGLCICAAHHKSKSGEIWVFSYNLGFFLPIYLPFFAFRSLGFVYSFLYTLILENPIYSVFLFIIETFIFVFWYFVELSSGSWRFQIRDTWWRMDLLNCLARLKKRLGSFRSLSAKLNPICEKAIPIMLFLTGSSSLLCFSFIYFCLPLML